MTNSLNKAGDLKVLSKIALSGGLILIMVVAPFCWGLLPRGYDVLNANPQIKANPYFTVFMRMLTSFLLTCAASILVWLWFSIICKDGKPGFLQLCGKTYALIKKRLPWLLMLSVCYFAARAVEMKCILTYSIEEGAVVADGTAKALKDYGYFMGLMLALLLAIKNNALYGMLAKLTSKCAPDFANNIRGKLCSGRMTFVGKIFWGSTLFLTIASGILYISAKEPLCVWPFVAEMSAIACIVALLTSFGTDFKILGNVNAGESADKCPAWLPALLASLAVNLFQSGGTAMWAILSWFGTRPDGVEFWSLASQYRTKENLFALVIVIGLLGSLIAPVSQLFGVNLHDAKLKRMGMTRYGVTGSDWLMICGGFEPLFVVLIGVCWPRPGDKVVSLIPMLVAVATVAVIALLKIAEVWAEKNSVVRNALFTSIRGSTQDKHEEESVEALRRRAIKLSLLKLYDKRNELFGRQVHFGVRLVKVDQSALGLPEPVSPDAYFSLLLNGQHFFTQDDPFTNTVLEAHAQYLGRLFPDVDACSLRRYLVNRNGLSASVWRSVVRGKARSIAVEGEIGEDSMPYAIMTNDEKRANAYISKWNELFVIINDAVRGNNLDYYINGLIANFSPNGKWLANTFMSMFHVKDPAEVAAKYRNPKTPELLAFAHEEGERLVKDCGVAGARYFVGGSLGYDAVLKGGFDIDLRLLVPGDWDDAVVRRNIDAAQKVLIDQAKANGEEIKCRFIDEGGTNYIQHTKQIVHQSWADGEIELTWNIQAENSYKSIAGMSAKLPQIVKDRYVAAKGLAKDESKEAYDALKVHWRDFIDWLVDHGAKDMDGKALDGLLLKARVSFPLFLKDKTN